MMNYEFFMVLLKSHLLEVLSLETPFIYLPFILQGNLKQAR